ncbi:MAG: hypothetical protein JNK78_09680 [Planctomycetes bacterium]|nr:hypothetical protein [Planctomycetota bacterium]
MNIVWNELETADDWRTALDSILAEARRASDENDDDERLDLCKVLRAFVLKSFPNTKPITDYDRIALEAQQALSEAVVDDALDRIEARTTTLIALRKEIAAVTEQTEAEVAKLRLDKAHTLIDTLTDASRALDDFDTVLVDGDDEELSKRLAEIAAAIAKFKALVQKKA